MVFIKAKPRNGYNESTSLCVHMCMTFFFNPNSIANIFFMICLTLTVFIYLEMLPLHCDRVDFFVLKSFFFHSPALGGVQGEEMHTDIYW